MNCVETAGTPGIAYAESPSRILGRDTERGGWPAGIVIIQSHVSNSVPGIEGSCPAGLQQTEADRERERDSNSHSDRDRDRKSKGEQNFFCHVLC